MGKEEFKNPHPELPVREPILKLGKMITDRVPIKLGFEKLTADSPLVPSLHIVTSNPLNSR